VEKSEEAENVWLYLGRKRDPFIYKGAALEKNGTIAGMKSSSPEKTDPEKDCPSC